MPERLQRPLLLILILYITFIGGTATPELYLGHRVFFQIVMTLLVVFWAIRMLIQRRSLPQTPLDLLLVLTALWFSVTTLFSHDWRMSFEVMWTYLLHIVLFYLMVDIVWAGRQRWLFEALFIVGGLVVMLSLLELVGWYLGLGFGDFKQGWFEIGGFSDPIPPTIHRLHLAFGFSTILSNYIVLLVPVVLAWALTMTQRDLRLALFILLGGLLGVQLLTFSRGGLIGTVVALGMMGLFWSRRASKLHFKVHIKLLIPVFVIGLLLFGLLIMVYSSRDDRDLGDRGRADMWTSTAEMMRDRPLTGFGMRQFGVIFRDYRDSSIIQDKLAAAHNLWLNTGAELGIPGLILLLSIGFIFLRVWLAAWGTTDRSQQIRLEGLLAALIGFAIHSMVDTFTLTTSVLPILIYGAYVFGVNAAPQENRSKGTLIRLRRWLPAPIMVISIIYGGWFLKTDLAQYSMSWSIQAIADDNLPNALHYANRAREIDPQLGLYDLHYAYVLGLLADENPSQYLDQAIDAHLAALDHDPTFDVFHVNLAALYLQRGVNRDYARAVEHLEQAVALNVRQGDHQLLLGAALEQQAITEGRDPFSGRLVNAYHRGIQRILPSTGSPFWDVDSPLTGHLEALESFYQDASPAERLIIAVQRNWGERAAIEYPLVEGGATDLELEAIGDYGLYMTVDYELAVASYSQVIAAGRLSSTDVAAIYVKRAEAYLGLADYDKAERDARTAIFLDPTTGARGNYVLALLEIAERNPPLDDEAVNQLLIDSIAPRTMIQYYASVVYLRPAAFDYLPQVQLIGLSRRTYEPWLLLAERYATDNNPNTNPQTVYDTLRREAPYLQIP